MYHSNVPAWVITREPPPPTPSFCGPHCFTFHNHCYYHYYPHLVARECMHVFELRARASGFALVRMCVCLRVSPKDMYELRSSVVTQ